MLLNPLIFQMRRLIPKQFDNLPRLPGKYVDPGPDALVPKGFLHLLSFPLTFPGWIKTLSLETPIYNRLYSSLHGSIKEYL